MQKSSEIVADTLSSHGKNINKIERDLERSNLIMMGVIIVLFTAMIGMSVGMGAVIVDVLMSKQDSYQELTKEIILQNQEINTFMQIAGKPN